MTLWQTWLRQPQTTLVRRALFQIHVWAGLGAALYVLIISVSGSVLVYRNELYSWFSPQPRLVENSGEPLTPEALQAAVQRALPGHDVDNIRAGPTPNHAVEVMVRRGSDTMLRLFNPFTGEDLGYALPAGYRATAWLLDLHDNLLAGPTGRRVNGVGALCLTILCATGAVVWWPGVRAWRRSLTIDRHANWRRLTWTLHSVLGFWFFSFLLLWAVTGVYLSWPASVGALFDWIEPFNEADPVERTVDRIQYWLAYLHFGRLGGRGIPGCGRGLCDGTTKLVWALCALVPPLMGMTGILMWWNRVIRRRRV